MKIVALYILTLQQLYLHYICLFICFLAYNSQTACGLGLYRIERPAHTCMYVTITIIMWLSLVAAIMNNTIINYICLKW